MSESNSIFDVLHDIKKSFFDDKKVLQDRIIEIETEIKECQMFIESLNRKDECDYNIFSPRSASRIYKDQVYEKKVRIEELEEELKSIYKRLSQVTKKLDSLDTINTAEETLAGNEEPVNDQIEDNEIFSDNQVSENSLSGGDDNLSGISEESRRIFLKMQEDDRQRIAAELHDSVLQNLSLLLHNFELSEKFIDIDPVRAKLEIASNRKIIKSAIDEMRNTIFDLRPMQFDDFGFKKSMENFLETIQMRTSIDIQYSIDDIDNLDNTLLLTVFRIIQELVNNAIKYSKASYINSIVSYENKSITIEVTDDGIGFDPLSINKENHFGLKILNDRINLINGEINYPSVQKGFKAVIIIPC